jgi:hypothetical protein
MADRVHLVITWVGGEVRMELPPGAEVRFDDATDEPDPDPFLASLTPAETGVLTELALRPDTRSRLANRLGISTSTLDNHLASVKRKLLEHLESAGQRPHDGYLSMEALIGWASRHMRA